MEVRDAGDGDIRAITEIYNDAVKNSTAIWNDATIDAPIDWHGCLTGRRPAILCWSQ